MNTYRRVAVFLSFVAFCAAVAMIGTALATERWFEAVPVHEDLNTTGNSIHAGLFRGVRRLNYGLGIREQQFSVFEELNDGVSFMTKSIWVCIVVFSALALLWTTVGIVFSLVNTVIKPIETIAGPLGIYLWSALAFISTVTISVLYLVQFLNTIQDNVLLEAQRESGFSSTGTARLAYSYWLMVGACGVLLLPILLLALSGIKCRRRSSEIEKEIYPTTEKGLFMY